MPVDELRRFVGFTVGDEEFGVDVMNVREVAKPMRITRVPRSPGFVEGVSNLRGELITIINLRKRLGFDPKEIDSESRIIIAELEDKPVGMLVDSATEVLKIPEKELQPVPEMVTTEISKDYLKGVGRIGERLIILLDLKQVLTKKEIEEIKAFEEGKAVKKLEKKIEGEKEEKGRPEEKKKRGKRRVKK